MSFFLQSKWNESFWGKYSRNFLHIVDFNGSQRVEGPNCSFNAASNSNSKESMGYRQEEDERHQIQQCRWAEGRYQSNLGFITPEQCHRLITSMPRRIDAVIKAKGGPTKYCAHRTEHNFQKPAISIQNILFLLILWNIQIFWDTEFGVFIICKP